MRLLVISLAAVTVPWWVGLGTGGAPAPSLAGPSLDDQAVLVTLDADHAVEAPATQQAAVQLARAAYARYRQHSDTRELGRAEAALAPWWRGDDLDRELRLWRATYRQAQHDFDAAAQDLEILAAERPTDVNVQLQRAAVAAVQGEFARVDGACEALRGVARPVLVETCLATVGWREGRGPARLAALMAQDDALAQETPAVAAWSLTVRAELADALGEVAIADAAVARAQVVAPDDVYAQSLWADRTLRLWAAPRAAAPEVEARLGEVRADGVRLRVAIAQVRRGGRPACGDLCAQLAEEIHAGAQRGDLAHEREHALYLLEIEADAAGALRAAAANWRLQRELIDARLYARAAAAAGARADAVAAWQREHHVDDVVLASLLEAP